MNMVAYTSAVWLQQPCAEIVQIHFSVHPSLQKHLAQLLAQASGRSVGHLAKTIQDHLVQTRRFAPEVHNRTTPCKDKRALLI